MSDIQNALATHASAPSAVVAKPRISADAFRNLTQRLKKPDAAIPSLPIPVELVIAPTVAPIVAPVVVAPMVEPVVVAPTVEPVVVAPTVNPVVVAPIEAPVVVAPEITMEVVEPGFDAIMPVTTTKNQIVEESTPLIAAIMPTSDIPTPIEIVQPIQAVAEAIVAPEISLAPPAPLPTETVLSMSAASAALQFPLLPEFVPLQVIVEPEGIAPVPAPEVEEVAPIKFEENFTYLPESGKYDDHASLADFDEASKQELAQRAVELELENIWRLLLAKPTNEERIAYLREATEIHAADEEWNKLEPEHDLSNIAPEPVEVLFDSSEIKPVAIAPKPNDSLPIAEGQDLAELTRSLLDMMAAGNASGLPQERALAADTLLRLVPRLELKPLMMLGQRLAMMETPPNLLVSRLIRDPRVEVAGPLLEDCIHITDKDLEQIIVEGETDKLRMIGRRRKLSRPISDALIKCGDASVVLTLVRNMEAEISHDGYTSLLLLCENHEELLAPLATRQDLAAPVAFELFWLAPAQLRRFILSRFLTDSETLTKILKITKMANAEDEAEGEPLSQFVLLEALERAARGHIEVASEELASVMQLNAATVARILGDLQGEAMVVMLKAAAYPRSSLPGLLKRLQDAEMPLISRERDITELQSMFETLSFNKARILLTYWDWAQSKTGPYEPVHSVFLP